MDEFAARIGVNFPIDPRAAGIGVQAGIEQMFRAAIEEGRLPNGAPVPSSRMLAQDIGVARGTVVAAYEALAATGWLEARRGSGTVVAAAVGQMVGPTAPDIAVVEQEVPRWDLRPGRPERGSFPKTGWATAVRRALIEAPDYVLDYGDPRGVPALREQLALYLARVRGLQVEPSNVIVCAGGRQAIAVEFECLRSIGVSRLAIEDPCFPLYRSLARSAGLEVVSLEVDEEGANPTHLMGASAGSTAAVLTPALDPLGISLSPGRRASFVAWANDCGGFICEDDYGGEFQFGRTQLPALQKLAPDRVVYGGTTAKVLAPGLRIAWQVVPTGLLERVLEFRRLAGGQCSSIDQLALAEFLRMGAYDRHLRKMRQRYWRRLVLLRGALARDVPWVRVSRLDAGLHVLIELPKDGPSEDDVLTVANRWGLAIEGLQSDGYTHNHDPGRQGLVVGYATPSEHSFKATVRALVETLKEARKAEASVTARQFVARQFVECRMARGSPGAVQSR